MTESRKLSELPLLTTAVVAHLDKESALVRRMMDLGIAEGDRITALFKSPFGDPTAYSVKDCVVALRKADCRGVLVEMTGEQNE